MEVNNIEQAGSSNAQQEENIEQVEVSIVSNIEQAEIINAQQEEDIEEVVTAATECGICFLSWVGKAPTTTPCGHVFCQKCIKRWLKNREKPCPYCRELISLVECTTFFL